MKKIVKYLSPFIILAALVFLIAAPLPAEDDKLGERETPESIKAEKINQAVDKACEWLIKQQTADGSWISSGSTEANYPVGTTALATLALLKGGVDRNNPAVTKGIEYIKKNWNQGDQSGQVARTYCVAVTVLALEAFYTEKTPQQEKEDEKSGGMSTVPVDQRARENFERFAGDDKKLMENLINWLVRNRHTGSVWRYPGAAQDGNPFDASNTQYAMLALNAGRRLGYNIPRETWIDTVKYFLEYQQADGPKVDSFRVPAADFPIAKLRELEAEFRKELRKIAKKSGRKGSDEKPDLSTEVNPYEKYGAETQEMKARGWSYVPAGQAKADEFPSFTSFCGSMTTSGIAALVIAKAGLENDREYHQEYSKKVDQAIRDGCAWLCHNYTVSNNPGKGGYNYYYLYGLERSGVLSALKYFGTSKNDWYEDGSDFLLGQQNNEGFWPGDSHESNNVRTCFAILFLCKATTPIVTVPEYAETGADFFKDKKK